MASLGKTGDVISSDDLDAKLIYANLAKDFGINLNEVSRRFGEIRLVQYDEGDERAYCYHPNLGIYQEV